MSLEERLTALTDALNNNTTALNAVLAAGGGTAPAAATEEKGKTTRKKADDKKADTAPSGGSEDVVVSKETTDAVLEWLGEFAKAEDKENPDGTHPEVLARRDALKKAYAGLKVGKLSEVKGEADVKRFGDWFEKAKAKGRFAPDPEPADDDMGI